MAETKLEEEQRATLKWFAVVGWSPILAGDPSLAMVKRLRDAGLLTTDATGNRYALTEAGRAALKPETPDHG